ncbi:MULTISPECIES: DUF2808 domain-containing protein [Aphanothece]|uniref:DUF2808 domain-containing protein n=1 Tax=Aphanothece TaxID=1121 RepID=UPI00398484A2
MTPPGVPPRVSATLLRHLAPLVVTAGLGAIATGLLPPAPLRALELRGATHFTRPPWKVTLRSYNSTVSQPSAEYYFTVVLAEDAGAALGELQFRQTRGVDTQFQFSPGRTRAFLGQPRREGPAVPVEAAFDQEERLVTVRFPEPVPPGSTLTVMLKPWANPSMSDTYLFQVMALPAGPNPSAVSLGFATLRIYDPDWR